MAEIIQNLQMKKKKNMKIYEKYKKINIIIKKYLFKLLFYFIMNKIKF